MSHSHPHRHSINTTYSVIVLSISSLFSIGLLLLPMLISDFGDEAKSTVTGATLRSNATTRTEKTASTTTTAKSKKHKDVRPLTHSELMSRIKFTLLGMIFFH